MPNSMTPYRSQAHLTSAAATSYGQCISIAPKPALAAASIRSKSGRSDHKKPRLAEKRGIPCELAISTGDDQGGRLLRSIRQASFVATLLGGAGLLTRFRRTRAIPGNDFAAAVGSCAGIGLRNGIIVSSTTDVLESANIDNL